MKKYSISIVVIALFVLAPVLLTGCQNKPEAPREGKFIGMKIVHQKKWRAICLSHDGETFEVTVSRHEKKVCGDREVSGEALSNGKISEGPLSGYEKAYWDYLEKNPQ